MKQQIENMDSINRRDFLKQQIQQLSESIALKTEIIELVNELMELRNQQMKYLEEHDWDEIEEKLFPKK